LSVVVIITRRRPTATLFPYTTLFRSSAGAAARRPRRQRLQCAALPREASQHALAPVAGGRSQLLLDSQQLVVLGHPVGAARGPRSEEHTSELQSRENLVCRLLLEKKK